jgi:LasA protease
MVINLSRNIRNWMVIILVGLFLAGCYRPGPGARPFQVSSSDNDPNNFAAEATVTPVLIPTVDLSQISAPSPTPNQPIALPEPRTESVEYTVQRGDTLRKIAQDHQVSIDQIVMVNDIPNPNLIDVGLVLLIPPPNLEQVTPAFKIIPDSELVYSPSNADFDIEGFISGYSGYLLTYSEEVDVDLLSGVEIVQRVALENSVNPRLLLAFIEYQSGWVTDRTPDEATLHYPMRYLNPYATGLYRQLSWAANLLNEGYYHWKEEKIIVWLLADHSVIQVAPTINPGTAGVLNLLRHFASWSDWEQKTSETGFFSIYYALFGYPFDFAHEPMIPEGLVQPELQLPIESGEAWSYTGGPHGGWNSGSAWAAVDFAPPGEPRGCYPSDAWVVASAPGEIVYSDHGAVIQDLEGDGVWQSGWSILYMHIDTNNRVPVGTYLNAGDKVGHPSCEGGFSSGTHLHFARRYNGEWVAADGDIPLVMDGWKVVSSGVEYNGFLIKGDQTLEAYNGRSPLNAINR